MAYPPGSSTLQPLCSEQFAAYVGQGVVFGGPQPVYTFSDYRIQAGFKNLTSNVDTLFTDAGHLITSTSCSYNSKNLLSSKNTTTSKAETLQTNNKYPFDYTGNSTLTQMVSLNMISYPVEQIENKGKLLPKIKNLKKQPKHHLLQK